METNELPRRNRLDLNHPAELAIYNAMQEVEKMPPSVKLTEAGIKLQEARNLVADFVDDPPINWRWRRAEETNELPEAVKRRIEAEYGDVSDRDYGIETLSSDIADGKIKAAEFGYRLGLQSCDEQLGSVESLVTTLEEQLKAKDEAYNALGVKFDKSLERWQERDVKQTKEVERLREGLITIRSQIFPPDSEMVKTIDTLLTETKPE